MGCGSASGVAEGESGCVRLSAQSGILNLSATERITREVYPNAGLYRFIENFKLMGAVSQAYARGIFGLAGYAKVQSV